MKTASTRFQVITAVGLSLLLATPAGAGAITFGREKLRSTAAAPTSSLTLSVPTDVTATATGDLTVVDYSSAVSSSVVCPALSTAVGSTCYLDCATLGANYEPQVLAANNSARSINRMLTAALSALSAVAVLSPVTRPAASALLGASRLAAALTFGRDTLKGPSAPPTSLTMCQQVAFDSVTGWQVVQVVPRPTTPPTVSGTVTCLPASGSTFPVGVTTVTCTLVDSAGLQVQDSFPLTVVVEPPVAVAGVDQTVAEGTLTTLDGAASTGSMLSWQWTQVAGPPVTLSNAAGSALTFTAPSLSGGFGSQVLTFALTVTNSVGTSSSTLNVTVTNVNHAPTAHASAPAAVNEGAAITLDGTGSFDVDGDALTYAWVQVGGPAVSANGAGPTLSFNAPMLAGGLGAAVALQFELTVSDGALTATESVTVLVEQLNHAPNALAGVDRSVAPGATVVLSAAGSSDPDGDLLSYSWTQTAGAPVTLTAGTLGTASFTVPGTAGPLVFTVQVADGQLVSSASVTINVIVPNQPPDCSHARTDPAVLWPPNHKLVPVHVVGITDAPGQPPVITITGVTQDEATGEFDRDDTARDAVIRADFVLLRAERDEHRDGRVYFVDFRATDASGASCTGTVSVGVPRSLGRGDEAKDSHERHDSRH